MAFINDRYESLRAIFQDQRLPLAGGPNSFPHAKAGALHERFSELFLRKGGKIIGGGKTYRGEGMSFL